MADGTLKSIEQVQAGDMVESKDPVSGKEQAKRVTRTFRNLAPAILTLALANGESIATTPGHPFATTQHGNFVLAGDLPLKTPLQEFDGHTVGLASETRQTGQTPIFNFEVEDFHTYFVGQSKLWVHNLSLPTPNVGDWADLSGFLRKVRQTKGNFGGTTAVTRAEADAIGQAWVGPNYRLMGGGKGYVSADGLKTFRFPSFKPKWEGGKWQCNLEWKNTVIGTPIGNCHLEVTP